MSQVNTRLGSGVDRAVLMPYLTFVLLGEIYDNDCFIKQGTGDYS